MKAKVLSVEPLKRPLPRVIEATGTPVSESPATAYTALRVLNPTLVPNVKRFGKYFEVRERMAVLQKKGKHKGRKLRFSRIVRFKNLDYLRTLLEPHTIRRLKTEVRGMPEVIQERREIVLPDKVLDSYDKLRRAVVDELRSDRIRITLDDAMVRSLRLRQFLEYPPLLGFDKLDGPKFAELDNILEEVLSNPMAKVIVWCNFVATVLALRDRYKQYNAAGLYEETSPEELARLGHTFDTDSCRVVIATPKKGGTGIDFLSRARTAIYLARPYSYIDNTQSVNRVVRRTAENPTTDIERIKASPATILDLYVPGTVDDLVAIALERKTALALQATPSADVLDISSDEVADLL